MRSLVFTLWLCLLAVLSGTGQTSSVINGKKKVFLLAGQSNMDGRGNGDDLTDRDVTRLAQVADRIDFYYNRQPGTPLRLTPASKYIEEKYGFTEIFGPELFFGIEIAEASPDDEFIFIKRTAGGTSLYGCWNPDWTYEKASLIKEENKPKLYSDFIEYTKSILSTYNENEWEIKGMLWVQGEHDGFVDKWGEAPAATYGYHLKSLVEAVREDLNVPGMPFVLFQVSYGKVVEGMITTAENDDRVFLIPQSKNEKSPDFYEQYPPPLWHYTTESMKRIGIEFFKIYNEIYK